MHIRKIVWFMAFVAAGAFAMVAPNSGASEPRANPAVQNPQPPNNPGPNAPNNPNGPEKPNKPNNPRKPGPNNSDTPNGPNPPSGPNNPAPPSGPNNPTPLVVRTIQISQAARTIQSRTHQDREEEGPIRTKTHN